MGKGREARAGGRRNAYACDTHRIRMDMHNNKGGDGIDYGGRGRERAVWRIIAAAAISANLIHQGKKQLRIIIDRLMEAGRAGRHGGVHLASPNLPHCAVGWKSYPSLKPRWFPYSVDFLESVLSKASTILHRCSANSETGLKSLLLGNAMQFI